MTILQQGSHRAPYAPENQKVPDGHYFWQVQDRNEKRGYTNYIASIRAGQLIALTVNGVADNGKRALAEVQPEIEQAVLTHCLTTTIQRTRA